MGYALYRPGCQIIESHECPFLSQAPAQQCARRSTATTSTSISSGATSAAFANGKKPGSVNALKRITIALDVTIDDLI